MIGPPDYLIKPASPWLPLPWAIPFSPSASSPRPAFSPPWALPSSRRFRGRSFGLRGARFLLRRRGLRSLLRRRFSRLRRRKRAAQSCSAASRDSISRSCRIRSYGHERRCGHQRHAFADCGWRVRDSRFAPSPPAESCASRRRACRSVSRNGFVLCDSSFQPSTTVSFCSASLDESADRSAPRIIFFGSA